MPTPITKLSSAAKTYVGVVIIAGIAAVADSAAEVLASPPQRGWAVLAALTLLTGSLTLKIPTISARLSVSEVFVFALSLVRAGVSPLSSSCSKPLSARYGYEAAIELRFERSSMYPQACRRFGSLPISLN